MENRIKEQLSLFADRMSTETLRANQLPMLRQIVPVFFTVAVTL